MMPPEQAAFVVAESLKTLTEAIEPRHDRDRILILRCILALTAAEIYKLTDAARVDMELLSLAEAMRGIVNRAGGKLDA